MRVKPILPACALVLGFAALGAGPALAGDPGSAGGAGVEAQPKPKVAKKDPSRRVCRNIIPSGSRLSVRDCRTQGDWDRAAEQAQDGALSQQLGPGGRASVPPQ